jgi:hypothetical protein
MIGGISRWMVNAVEKNPLVQTIVGKQTVKSMMASQIPEPDLRGLPLVTNPKVSKLFESHIRNKSGGVFVVAAPPGSGKSTYLRQSGNAFIQSGGHARFISSEVASYNQFFRAFGVDELSGNVFNWMPQRSVIIFDQIEKLAPLNVEMRVIIRRLAEENCRVPNRNVIISTSNIHSAKEILKLGENDTIHRAGQCTDFMWGYDLVHKFMQSPPFVHWSEAHKQRLMEHAVRAACPRFLYGVANMCGKNGYPEKDEIFAMRAEHYAQTWQEFREEGF